MVIRYFGYSYYESNKDKINLLSIDNVIPSMQTINDESYLLSRPLRIYFDKNDLGREEINEFLKFYLLNSGTLSEEVNLVRLSDKDYEDQLKNLK